MAYKQLENSKGEFAISLDPQDLSAELQQVLRAYQEHLDIKGFRKGKIPEHIIRTRVGEVKLSEEALEKKLPVLIDQACSENNVDIYGQPDIRIQKIAAGNPIELTVAFTRLPHVTLQTYTGLNVKKKKVTIEPASVDKTLNDLKRMYAKESLIARPAQKGDKVQVDFDAFVDNIPLDGGSSKKQPIILGDSTFIPGFEEQLIGMQAGEEKKFTLRFPKDYRRKDLANRDVEFKAKVHSVFSIEQPILDDAFAKQVGMDTLENLRKQLEKNLHDEATNKEEERLELEMIQALVKKTTIESVPEVMIIDEKERMIEELEQAVTRDGGKFDDYLSSIKKTKEDLKKEFTSRAEERIKTALFLRAIAEDKKMYAAADEIDKAIMHEKAHHKDNPTVLQQINSPTYRRHVAHALTTQNVINFLKKENTLP